MKKALRILTVAAIGAAIMTTIGCASAPPLMYERGDYAEYSPMAVRNIQGAPEQIITTSRREANEKRANQKSSSLLGALKNAAVDAVGNAVADAIAIDLDEAAIAAEGEKIIRAAYAKGGISLVDINSSPIYNEWQAPTSKGFVAVGSDDKMIPKVLAEIGAKGVTSAVFDIEIAEPDNGKLRDLFEVYPKVTLTVWMRDAQNKELITPITFTPRIDAAPAKGKATPTAAIDDKYVLTGRVKQNLASRYDKDEFTALTYQAMQMCADMFVDYLAKGKQDFPGTYKGKK